mgnify:CR=1 FL=1
MWLQIEHILKVVLNLKTSYLLTCCLIVYKINNKIEARINSCEIVFEMFMNIKYDYFIKIIQLNYSVNLKIPYVVIRTVRDSWNSE